MLLPEPERSRSGYRLFTESHVVRVELIRTLREAGIGLDATARCSARSSWRGLGAALTSAQA